MRRTAVAFVVLALTACAGEGSAPPPGGQVTTMWEVEGQGTEAAGPMIDPSVVLVRDEGEAEAAAANAPVRGAADLLRSWDRHGELSLVLVYGGTVPDAGHSIEVDGIALNRDAVRLIVSAELTVKDPALQVLSIPWTAISVEAELVAQVETCALTLDGRELPEAACPTVVLYASK